MIDGLGAVGLLGMLSIVVALVLLGLLSKRMAHATRTPAYYLGFYVAAFFVAIGVLARLFYLTDRVAPSTNIHDNIAWAVLFNGAPTLGVTLGVIIAWRYWSWLLAERS